MTPLFGLVFAILATVLCWAAVTVTRAARGWLAARALRRRGDGDTVEIVRRPLRRLATYAALVVLAVPAGLLAGGTALPGPSGGFGGGTVGSAVVLTGDNASGTGTLRIRPSDEDTQLVLCEASNNASPEVCSVVQHYNQAVTSGSLIFGSNIYLDPSSAYQRYNTSFGSGYIQTVASSTLGNNGVWWGAYNTSGTIASYNNTLATGASTATTLFGGTGTMTVDFRGPITNGGSATCNGILAGYECHNDDVMFYSANGLITTQATNATAATGITLYSSGSVNTGALAYGNASISDADLASKVFLRGVGSVVGIHRTDDVAAGSTVMEVMDNTSATGVLLMDVRGNGTVRPLLYGSQSNCSDGAGAAACTAAPAGSVVIDDGATTVVVSTTAVTANSQIFPVFDSSLGTKLGVTCNTTAVTPSISARTAATSFTITAADPAGANPACFSYLIVN